MHLVFEITEQHKNDTKDTLAVLGFFFEVSEKENEFLKEWNFTNNIGKEFEFSLENFSNYFNGVLDEYYHYMGSLTTPGSNEIVNWFVFKNPLKMSFQQKAQLDKFFKNNPDFANGNGNNRKIQDLNNREIGTSSIYKCSGIEKQNTIFKNSYFISSYLYITILLLILI